MFYTYKENLRGVAIFLDFRKAFNTIEWHYLKKVLTLLNFGPNFLLWFKTLHANITSCVFNNRHASCLFPLNRSLRQGCPLSGLLFVISLELLARSIKHDNLFKGITNIYVYRWHDCFCTLPWFNNSFTKYAGEISNQHV